MDIPGTTTVQWLVNTLQQQEYFFRYSTAIDNPNRLTNLFFAYPESIQLLAQSPDILLLDCTHKTNRFQMPLLNICGVSGNNMKIQIALALLSGEDQKHYTWAL